MDTILLPLSGGAWLATEVTLRIHDRMRGLGGTADDRGTRRFSGALLIAAILLPCLLGILIPVHSPLRIPGGAGALALLGALLIWLGLALRIWSVVTLGNSFRTTVEVDHDQSVISHGPYRLVRHPSYSGLLLTALGFGVGFGTWPGLVLGMLLAVPGLLRRIEVEEAEMVRVLGDPYRAYLRRTKRLVPGIW